MEPPKGEELRMDDESGLSLPSVMSSETVYDVKVEEGLLAQEELT